MRGGDKAGTEKVDRKANGTMQAHVCSFMRLTFILSTNKINGFIQFGLCWWQFVTWLWELTDSWVTDQPTGLV